MARALLPLGLEKMMNTAAPIDRGAQFIRSQVGELGRPMAAEAGADDGDFGRFDFGSFEQIIEHGDVDLMSIRSGEQRAFSRARTIDDKTSPTFFDETLAKRMAFFFPVVDAAPMHDHRGRQFPRQSQMTDNKFTLEGNRHAFDRNVEIL